MYVQPSLNILLKISGSKGLQVRYEFWCVAQLRSFAALQFLFAPKTVKRTISLNTRLRMALWDKINLQRKMILDVNAGTVVSIWEQKRLWDVVLQKKQKVQPNQPNRENGGHQILRETFLAICSGSMLRNNACWVDWIHKLITSFLQSHNERKLHKSTNVNMAE